MQIPHGDAVFTPNPERPQHVEEMQNAYNAKGVIHYCLQFCQPYQMEGPSLERHIQAAGVPVLNIETDYSAEDSEQLRTRVEAFVEQIRR